ncbi:MAG: site-specific integrase [Burkholderiaceae bacterium]
MAQAKTLTPDQLRGIVEKVVTTSHRPWTDAVLFALSFKAGLRACEMAGLKWRDVMTADGSLIEPLAVWHIPDKISKKGRGRKIPMHPDLYGALKDAMINLPKEATKSNRPLVPKMLRGTGGIDPVYAHCKPNTLVQYIKREFDQAGAIGCSSHSGRRTFITQLARRANSHGCSLRDVQLLAGHSEIATTERYIDLSDNAPALVGSL